MNEVPQPPATEGAEPAATTDPSQAASTTEGAEPATEGAEPATTTEGAEPATTAEGSQAASTTAEGSQAASTTAVAATAPMTEVAPPQPARVSDRSRLLGLAVLALMALGGVYLWRLVQREPDATRAEAARVAARPHWAAFARCLLGAPLEDGETPAQRLRNVALANATLTPEPDWPARCAVHASAVIAQFEPVRTEDTRIDRLVSSLRSARIALARGQAPRGADTLWDAADGVVLGGGQLPAGVRSARAPLRPLTASAATRAALGPRQQRVLRVEAHRLLLGGASPRLCQIRGARVACASGPEVPAASGVTLVPTATSSPAPSAIDQAQPADLLLVRSEGAPARLLDAATWSATEIGDDVYGVVAQRGGVLLLRDGARRAHRPPTSIVLTHLPEHATPPSELALDGSLILRPLLVPGFAYFATADMRLSAARRREAPQQPGVDLVALVLPTDVGSAVPPVSRHHLDAMPTQVLGCSSGERRHLAFLTAPDTDGDEVLPRVVELHSYDARGAQLSVLRGELLGSAAVIDCSDDRVQLLARKQVAVNRVMSLQITGLSCDGTRCESASATVPMHDVGDAITLRDGRVLVVYRTAAAGGLRARVARLAELSEAPERVIADEAVYGGMESTRRWLVSEGDTALLVLEARSGVVAVRMAADGTATLLAPQ